jgi:hypothetical protein
LVHQTVLGDDPFSLTRSTWVSSQVPS